MEQQLNTVNSAVGICSQALVSLGGNPINDFEENTDSARLCANLYPSLRAELLRFHPWLCCLKRARLAEDVDKPAFGWQHSYTLPGDCLRVMGINDGRDLYTIESGKLLTDAGECRLKYVWLNDNEASWSAQLVKVMVITMKAALAYPITKDLAARNAFEQERMLALKFAKTVDGMEIPPQEFSADLLIEARYR